MERPVKTVRIGDRSFHLTGLDETDPYFASIVDGHEAAFTSFCRNHLTDDAVCLDIGANIGVKTMAMSCAVPRGTVIAVEPGPAIADLLGQNVESNRLRNVRVRRTAVGDRDGEVTFLAQSAYGHIAAEPTQETVTVPISRVATLLAQEGLDRLDFVKIDVEGFEFPIVRDALELFDVHRTVVMLEFNSWCQLAFADVNPREFMSWLFDHFAYVARLTPAGGAGELVERVEAADALSLLHQNLVLDGCVSDLVVTNHPERLGASARVLADRLDAIASALDETAAERDRAVAERDAALRGMQVAEDEAAALRASTSWRLTAPMRGISGLLRRS